MAEGNHCASRHGRHRTGDGFAAGAQIEPCDAEVSVKPGEIEFGGAAAGQSRAMSREYVLMPSERLHPQPRNPAEFFGVVGDDADVMGECGGGDP